MGMEGSSKGLFELNNMFPLGWVLILWSKYKFLWGCPFEEFLPEIMYLFLYRNGGKSFWGWPSFVFFRKRYEWHPFWDNHARFLHFHKVLVGKVETSSFMWGRGQPGVVERTLARGSGPRSQSQLCPCSACEPGWVTGWASLPPWCTEGPGDLLGPLQP